MGRSKDPLRKPGVESNHQPFELESNALPLALPGLAHANSRTISTKEQPFFIAIFTVYRLHLMFGSEALGAVAGGEGLHRASRREGRHFSRGRNVGRASRGRAKGVLGDQRDAS